MLTTNHHKKGPERANKIYVHTKYSSDGRTLEGFWMDYDPSPEPSASYSLFLLEFVLNNSEGVEYYSVYDQNGDCCKFTQNEFNPRPKRI